MLGLLFRPLLLCISATIPRPTIPRPTISRPTILLGLLLALVLALLLLLLVIGELHCMPLNRLVRPAIWTATTIPRPTIPRPTTTGLITSVGTRITPGSPSNRRADLYAFK